MVRSLESNNEISRKQRQGVQLFARLGTSTLARPATPTYFTASSSGGRYLASFEQQAILQQGVPVGHELRLRTGVSEPLWFPPEEVALFRLADWLREAGESRAQVQRQPDFGAAARRAPAHWDLSGAEGKSAAFGQPASYRFAGPTFEAVAGPRFTLHYVGTRTTADQPHQLVFTLEIAGNGPRTDVPYHTVDAGQGGQLDLTVAGARYQVRIEPLAQGHLTAEIL